MSEWLVRREHLARDLVIDVADLVNRNDSDIDKGLTMLFREPRFEIVLGLVNAEAGAVLTEMGDLQEGVDAIKAPSNELIKARNAFRLNTLRELYGDSIADKIGTNDGEMNLKDTQDAVRVTNVMFDVLAAAQKCLLKSVDPNDVSRDLGERIGRRLAKGVLLEKKNKMPDQYEEIYSSELREKYGGKKNMSVTQSHLQRAFELLGEQPTKNPLGEE